MKLPLRTNRRASLLTDWQADGSRGRTRRLGGFEQLEARTVLSGMGLPGLGGSPNNFHDHFIFERATPAHHEIIVAEGEYAPRPGGGFGPPGPIMVEREQRGGGPDGGQLLNYRGLASPPTT